MYHDKMNRCLLLPILALAATAQQRVEFEVASIKAYVPAPTGGRAGGGCPPFHMDHSRIDICDRLAGIIGYAYDVSPDRVEGPDFVHDRRGAFQIQAKLPEGTSPSLVPQMMQALLADRFQLKVHRGTRQQQMTAMIVGKGGLKLMPSSGEAGEVHKTETAGPTIRWQSSGITLEELAWLCDGINFVPPVVDMTGVKGRFQLDMTVHLKDTFDAAARPGDAGRADMHDEMMRAVDEALTPLGLRLEMRKGTVGTVVVDHVERTPSGN